MMKYKGINKEKVLEVQKVKLHNTDAYAMFTEKELENLCKNTDAFKRLHEQIELQHKARKNDTEMAIICEMAMMYLDGLKDKETADKEAYNKGLNYAWELARKIFTTDCATLQKVLGSSDEGTIIMLNEPQAILAKLEAYEKEQAEIKVGDVVLYKKEGVEIVITRIYGNSFDGVKVKSDQCGIAGATYYSRNLCDCKKTGKHIDIQKILDELKEGNDNAWNII